MLMNQEFILGYDLCVKICMTNCAVRAKFFNLIIPRVSGSGHVYIPLDPDPDQLEIFHFDP